MTLTAFALTLAAAFAAPDDDKKPAAGDAAKAETAKMEGTWTFEKVVANGETRPADELKGMKLEVKGDKRTVSKDGEVQVKSTYKFDPKASPKTIDITIERDGETITLKGLYELDGDTFTTCLGLPGQDRPKKIEAGEGVVLQVVKRVKAEKK